MEGKGKCKGRGGRERGRGKEERTKGQIRAKPLVSHVSSLVSVPAPGK